MSLSNKAVRRFINVVTLLIIFSVADSLTMSLSNKVAIVTGSSSGIGAAIAEKFAAEGARVTIVGRNETKLNAVAKRMRQAGAQPLAIIADVTKKEDAEKIISETIKHFGKLDILVNNAGLGRLVGILAEDIMEQYDVVMNTNVRSVVYLIHLAAPHIIASKGNIINISSVASMIPSVFFLPYSTSKAALDHFTRCVAKELAPKGVRVNAINPGPVNSDFLANTGVGDTTVTQIAHSFADSTALKRFGDPEEIADLAAFVASDRGRSITGSCIVTDNGASLGA